MSPYLGVTHLMSCTYMCLCEHHQRTAQTGAITKLQFKRRIWEPAFLPILYAFSYANKNFLELKM